VEVLGKVAVTVQGRVPTSELLAAGEQEGEASSVVVAVRQGSILATAFHPELTDDLRWHR
jgi:5'-phosphate synthase pdxT subunit